MASYHFVLADYIIFATSLLLSMLVGIVVAFHDRKEKSVDGYFLGNRKMSPITVGLSLAVSCISSKTMMGLPVEVYLHGTAWFWNGFSIPLVMLLAINYFLPLYFKLNIKCVYEYLEMRFNKSVRIISSLSGICFMMIYLPSVTFYPALALSTVMPISIEWSLLISVGLCTTYTVVGGFKSVVWADAIQAFIMLAGCFALLIFIVMKVGGVPIVLAEVKHGNRDTFSDFSTDIFKHCTALGQFQLGFFDWLSIIAVNQTYVQRYLSCKSLQKAKHALYISLLPQLLITWLSLFIGMAMYSYLSECDPVENGNINGYNQLLPYIVSITTKSLPGLNGLFVASVYSGTLSTVSSGINSLTVMIMEDIVSIKWTIKDSTKKLRLSKLCGICIGVIHLAISYSFIFIEGTVVEISLVCASAFSTLPVCIFILGIFTPWANSTGTIVGAMVGFSVNLWLSIGSIVHDRPSQILPVSTAGCNVTDVVFLLLQNVTISPQSNTATIQSLLPEHEYTPYDISYMYTRLISLLISLPVGLLVSKMTGPTNAKTLNPDLFSPIFSNRHLPEKFLKFWSCGVPVHQQKNEKNYTGTKASSDMPLVQSSCLEDTNTQ